MVCCVADRGLFLARRPNWVWEIQTMNEDRFRHITLLYGLQHTFLWKISGKQPFWVLLDQFLFLLLCQSCMKQDRKVFQNKSARRRVACTNQILSNDSRCWYVWKGFLADTKNLVRDLPFQAWFDGIPEYLACHRIHITPFTPLRPTPLQMVPLWYYSSLAMR